MDTLIAFGDGIKSAEETDDSYKFGAFLVVFDSADVSRFKDSFTKSTDFGFEEGETRPLMYNHGLDGTVGKATIGKARLYMKDAGVWMEGVVKKRKDYLEEHIQKIGEGLAKTISYKGIDVPVFGTSSGATGHGVVREAKGSGHEIKQWHIGEASITPTPAEPQTGCMSLKSLGEMEIEQGIAIELPEIKAGRTISSDNHTRLSTLCGNLKSAVIDLETFLEAHALDAPAEQSKSETKATEETTVAVIDDPASPGAIADALSRHAATLAHISSVTV